MHGAMPQLSSAAASAAVDHDEEPASLSGIRTDQAKINGDRLLIPLHIPRESPFFQGFRVSVVPRF